MYLHSTLLRTLLHHLRRFDSTLIIVQINERNGHQGGRRMHFIMKERKRGPNARVGMLASPQLTWVSTSYSLHCL